MSICIECAVTYHDFKEVPSARGEGRRVGALAGALIDGRKYRLDRVDRYHVACDRCCRVSRSLFFPADR